MTITTRRSARMFGAVFALTLCVIATYDHLRLRTYEAVGVVGLPWDKSMIHDAYRPKPILEWTTPDFDQVAGKIPKDQQALFMEPYGYDPSSGVDSIIVVLMKNMSRRPARFFHGIEISYQHPDPHMALLGATLFVEQAISNYAAREKTERLAHLSEFEIMIEYRKRDVDERAHEIDDFKKRKPDPTDRIINREKLLQVSIERRDSLEKLITEMRAGPDPSDELRVLNPPTLPHPNSYLRPRFLREFRWRLMLATALGGIAAILWSLTIGPREGVRVQSRQ